MYNKLFAKILDSSIWLEPTPTRIVWLTFIAAMDEQGLVQFASVANVAHRARVSLDEAEHAIACLEGPDADSGDPAHEGRRLERIPGGWLILNAEKHRALVTKAVLQEQTRERVRRHRARLRNGGNGEPLNVTPSEAVSEAEEENTPKPPFKKRGPRVTRAERKEAKIIRDRGFGGCPHEPRCDTEADCLEWIALNRRPHGADS